MQMILSCEGDQYGHLDTLNIKIHPLFQILLTEQDVERSLVPILATKKALAPLANDPIMSGSSIQLKNHQDASHSKIVPRIPKNTGPQWSKQTRAELLENISFGVLHFFRPWSVSPLHPPSAHTHPVSHYSPGCSATIPCSERHLTRHRADVRPGNADKHTRREHVIQDGSIAIKVHDLSGTSEYNGSLGVY